MAHRGGQSVTNRSDVYEYNPPSHAYLAVSEQIMYTDSSVPVHLFHFPPIHYIAEVGNNCSATYSPPLSIFPL